MGETTYDRPVLRYVLVGLFWGFWMALFAHFWMDTSWWFSALVFVFGGAAFGLLMRVTMDPKR